VLPGPVRVLTVHTVELLPDEALSEGVRDLWGLLLDAGLPSLATHRHPTNRPHLTLLTASSAPLTLGPLPLPVRADLGPVRFLGRALVRLVEPSPSLRALQASVWSSLGGRPAPADWVPHISLALRGASEEALTLLAGLPPVSGSFVAARTYDTETRAVRDLP
jgi:hypothetical protein